VLLVVFLFLESWRATLIPMLAVPVSLLGTFTVFVALGFSINTLTLFALVLAIFYFIILLPMKRKQQKVQEFLDSLKVGDRVITTGGIYGQITRLGEQSVQLQIADKVRIEVSRAAVGGIQGQAPVVEPASQ